MTTAPAIILLIAALFLLIAFYLFRVRRRSYAEYIARRRGHQPDMHGGNLDRHNAQRSTVEDGR